MLGNSRQDLPSNLVVLGEDVGVVANELYPSLS